VASDLLPEDIRNVWQKQPSEGAEMLLEEVRKRITKFEREQWRIKIVGRISAIVVLAVLGSWFYFGNESTSIGTALVLAGFVYAWRWVDRGRSPKVLPPDCGLESSVDFYRAELERERNVQRGMWRAYLAVLPGMVVAIGALQYGRTPRFAQHFFPTAASVVAVCFLCWLFNLQQARLLQRRIDDLEAMVKGN
jgi:hypothetical protein